MKIQKVILIQLICFAGTLLFSQLTTQELLIKREIETIREEAKNNRNNLKIYQQPSIDYSDTLKAYNVSDENQSSAHFELKYYGYDLFSSFPERLIWDNQPPTGDYIIGTGDEVIIEIWGDTQLRAIHIVDQYGKINIDKIGQIYLSGLALKDVKKKLLHKFQNVYSSLKGQENTAFLDISIGKLKSINVTFLGETMIPGIHAIHPYSTIITALMQTGGINKIGSLRNIQIIRKGKTKTTLDIYDYFLKGNAESDIRLLDGDILFIPVRYTTNFVTGQVMRPAIYELLPNETLADIIHFAGGLKANSHRIMRIFRFETLLTSSNTYLVNLKTNPDFILQNGDEIIVYEIAESDHQVFVYGQVKNPGAFAFDTQNETRVLDVLTLAGGIKDETYLKTMYQDVGEIIRNNPYTDYPEIIKFNISNLISGDTNENKLLQNWDIVLIRQNPNYQSPKKVTLTGEVKIPGIYTIQKKWENLDDILIRAGGFTSKAFQSGIQLYRNHKQVALKDFEIVLLDGDSLMVPEHPGVVQILGGVNRPGLVQYDKKKSLRDYLENAGGYTQNADKHNITIIFANGDVRIKKWFLQPKIGEGATIIVHLKEELEPFSLNQFATSFSSIITAMATLYLLIIK